MDIQLKKCLLCLLLFIVCSVSATEDTVCAVVKIEINQELTLERQGFEATMKINNALDSHAITDIDVTVNFLDAEGEPVVASSDPNHASAKFFIRQSSLEGIDDVSGKGELAPQHSAVARWLIIPAPGTGGEIPSGTLYYVGAKLSYKLNGQQDEIVASPDSIFVKPMPKLTLDYFLPRDVHADNPLTDEIEPIQPFTLGVRVRNNGSGTANKVKIDSAQPEIVENKQGLLIDFEITGSFIDDTPASNSLLLDFGDIHSQESATGRWIMQTTLSGRFTDFDATYSHSDELGGKLTSLIEAIKTHELVRDVVVELPGRDDIHDFLAYQGSALTVFESDSVDTPVVDHSRSASIFKEKDEYYKLSFSAEAGAAFVRLPDIFDVQKRIVQVIRSDGRVINLQNIWFSSQYDDKKKRWDRFLNLFDTNTTGVYFVNFGEAVEEPAAPTLRYIPNMTGYEGGQIGFLIEATDPNNEPVSLSVMPLPVGSVVTKVKPGVSRFNWKIKPGQVGNFPIIVTASDGQHHTNQRVMLTVNPGHDTDGDGLDDDWERENFGDLSRDGTGDYDNDGISDFDEFEQGSDPTLDNGPLKPEIVSPENVIVTNPAVMLLVNNAVYGGEKTISYFYEVYRDKDMTQLIAASGPVDEGQLQTAWRPSEGWLENTHHYWRVRAFNGNVYSPWNDANFYFNQQNEAPTKAIVNSPVNGTEIDTLMPLISVINSADPDGDELIYQFFLYSDESLSTLIASSSNIVADDSGITKWQSTVNLQEGETYYWQAVVSDSDGLQSVSGTYHFDVFKANHQPEAPMLVAPTIGAEIKNNYVDIIVSQAIDADGDDVSYEFELDTVATFDSEAKRTEILLPPLEGNVTWTVDRLVDKEIYYWRVRAFDVNGAYSETLNGHFKIKQEVILPPVPAIKNPGNGSWVSSKAPVLSIYPVTDSDRPIVGYDFELYAEKPSNTLVESSRTKGSQYQLQNELVDNAWYNWRVRAIDSAGYSSTWSPLSRFYVDDPGADTPPSFSWIEPETDISISVGEPVTLSWQDADPDSKALISLYYNKIQDNTVIDTLDRGFTLTGWGWEGEEYGELDERYYVFKKKNRKGSAIWTIPVGVAGRYKLQAYWPESEYNFVKNVNYAIKLSGSNRQISAQVKPKKGWVTLGGYELEAGNLSISLNGKVTGYRDHWKYVIADKMRLVPVDLPNQLIADGIHEDDSADRYLWDTSSVTPGQYQITGIIKDESNTLIQQSPVTVTIKSPPFALIDNQSVDASYSGKWTVSNSITGYWGGDYHTVTLNPEDDGEEGEAEFSWSFSIYQDGWYGLSLRNLPGFDNNLFELNLVSDDDEVELRTLEEVAVPTWSSLGKHWMVAGKYTLTAEVEGSATVAADAIEVRKVRGEQNSSPLEIDNDSFGFESEGRWGRSSKVQGYKGVDYAFICPGSKGKASWEVELNQPGLYEVFVTWTSDDNRASNARYTVHHSSGHDESAKTTILKDQRKSGGIWQSLGVFNFASEDAKVELTSNFANGCVVADSLKLVKRDASSIVLDNDSKAFSSIFGFWSKSTSEQGYEGKDFQYSWWGKAFWKTEIVESGKYRVDAKWTTHRNRSTSVTYGIHDDFGEVGKVAVSQQQNGGEWQTLGEYHFSSGDIRISIENDLYWGVIVADAVRLTKVVE